jgi:hypothetical protein
MRSYDSMLFLIILLLLTLTVGLGMRLCMCCKLCLFFTGQSINSVVDCKYVLRVKCLLQVLHKIDGHWWECLLHKSLPDLTDSVMMGNAASTLEDLISAVILYILVNLHNEITSDLCIIKTKVYVDSCSCFI